MTRHEPPTRIAIRAPNWLGDGVMARAAIADVTRSFPDASVECFAVTPVDRVVRGLGADVVTLPAGRAAGFRVIASRAASVTFEAGLVMPPSFSSALAFVVARIPRRVGFADDRRSVLLSRSVPRATRGAGHLEDEYRSLAEAAVRAWGRAPVAGEAPPLAPIAAGAVGRDPYLVLAPGARYGSTKRWSPDAFAAIADRYVDRTGGRVVVVGAVDDRAVAGEVVGHARVELDNRVGRTSIDELVSIVASADAVVTNDSGAMHVAAAAGAPTVAVFGSTNPDWTGPRGRRVRVVRHPVDCAPCYRPTCDIGRVCLTGVSADMVWAAVEEHLAAGRAT